MSATSSESTSWPVAEWGLGQLDLKQHPKGGSQQSASPVERGIVSELVLELSLLFQVQMQGRRGC